jgi:Protein of unknown function (DUF1573)
MNVYIFLVSLVFSSFNFQKEKECNFASIVQWEGEVDFDFGEAKRGAVLKHTFKFKNLDSQPIMIETARTTCGCTAASWTQTPIAPNEIGEILVEYDSNKTGDFRKKIKVFFDRQKKGESLWVTGNVE